MADIFSSEKRSEIMSHISSKNTSIELQVFAYLKLNKIRFRKHYKKLPGNPDIVIAGKKKAVFIDGDFWHGYGFKKFKDRLPNSFWITKISNNIIRDRKNRKILRKKGWQVYRVWQHELEKYKEKALFKILKFLTD